MSYLNPLRLHFAGRFQAATSTVNNDPLHYDNKHFKKPEYQDRATPGQPNGWWNPRGDADWRLIGCQVTAAWRCNGQPVDGSDPVLQCVVADSDQQVSAKMADLDPYQQMVSEIWGLEVRICAADGDIFLRGHFVAAAFMDIWNRCPSEGGDGLAGAMYQSVLTELQWGNISRSPWLRELQCAASDGLLSIKFNVDSFDANYRSPTFTLGRVAGTIGPASADEPRHFVAGRQLMTTAQPGGGGFFAPAGQLNFCVAALNQEVGKLYLDLGNALPITGLNQPAQDLGTLIVGYQVPTAGGGVEFVPIGEIPGSVYTDPGWYDATAGVVELPSGRSLSPAELSNIEQNPLAVTLTTAQGQPAVAEPPDGLYLRADQFVFRLSPDECASVRLYATQFGQPYKHARVISILDPNEIQALPTPPAGEPPSAIDFPARIVTDERGVAELPIRAGDPGKVRKLPIRAGEPGSVPDYIDGQVYGVRPMLEDTISPSVQYPFNQWDFVSVLIWSGFHADEPPTWYGSLQPIFQQYANLYPVMQRFLDLADYDSICAHRSLLQLAFGLGPDDPNSMPVTRDLSPAKRQAILRWLTEMDNDGKPRKGTPPPALAEAAELPAVPAAPVPGQLPDAGKLSAANRRLKIQRRHWVR